MTGRETVGRIQCQTPDGGKAEVLVYRLGNSVTLVSTVESDGDIEVMLDPDQIKELQDLLGSS